MTSPVGSSTNLMELARERSTSLAAIKAGSTILIAGIVITLGSYVQSKDAGRGFYMVSIGALIVGILGVLSGLRGLSIVRRKVARLEELHGVRMDVRTVGWDATCRWCKSEFNGVERRCAGCGTVRFTGD